MNFKHMLFRAASALLLVSGLGFAGCDDADPDAFLSVTRQEIEVEYTGLTTEGEMVNFELGTNRSWRATYVEEWIHLTHTEGDRGRVRIFLSIDENNTGEDRTGFIIFEGDGGTRRTIAVTQKLKVDALSVTPAKITVVKSGLLETGEKAAIFISTNCDWEISVADDSKWISPVKTSGAPGDESIDLDIAQNTTDGVRTGTFTVTADSKTATVTVTQNLEGLKVSVNSFSVNKFGLDLLVKRLSDSEDRIPVMVSERLVDVTQDYVGQYVEIHGQFRSYNRHEEKHNRLVLSAFARELKFLEEEDSLAPVNQIFLDGYICKPPVYRKTPLGREIADLLLAVNRPYGKSDYIPCICWGRNARYASAFEVGGHVLIWGRIQSREYMKRIGENETQKRIAYEVSVSKLEYV